MATHPARAARGPYRERVTLPATADRWEDLAGVMATPGESSSCWCQWFRESDSEWDCGTAQRRRDALWGQVGGEVPPGVLAYAALGEPAQDGEEPDLRPVGWAAVAPAPGYPRLSAEGALEREVTEDAGTWFISCLVVPAEHRRHGVGTTLVNGAFELARQHGATRVVGHPVDVAAQQTHSDDDLFHGTLSMFIGCGFVETGRTSPDRPVVERVVSGPRRPSL